MRPFEESLFLLFLLFCYLGANACVGNKTTTYFVAKPERTVIDRFPYRVYAACLIPRLLPETGDSDETISVHSLTAR